MPIVVGRRRQRTLSGTSTGTTVAITRATFVWPGFIVLRRRRAGRAVFVMRLPYGIVLIVFIGSLPVFRRVVVIAAAGGRSICMSRSRWALLCLRVVTTSCTLMASASFERLHRQRCTERENGQSFQKWFHYNHIYVI